MLGGKKIGTGFYRIFSGNWDSGFGYTTDNNDYNIFGPTISRYRKKI